MLGIYKMRRDVMQLAGTITDAAPRGSHLAARSTDSRHRPGLAGRGRSGRHIRAASSRPLRKVTISGLPVHGPNGIRARAKPGLVPARATLHSRRQTRSNRRNRSEERLRAALGAASLTQVHKSPLHSAGHCAFACNPIEELRPSGPDLAVGMR